MTIFEVGNCGVLKRSGYDDALCNRDAYGISIPQRAAVKGLLADAESCPPLLWALAEIVADREDKEADAFLELAELREWFSNARKQAKSEVLERLDDWLDISPDPQFAEYLQVPADGQAAAFELLDARPASELEALKIEMVDGETPDHDVRYAILRMDIDAANLVAKSLSLPYAFEPQRARSAIEAEPSISRYFRQVPLEKCLTQLAGSPKLDGALRKRFLRKDRARIIAMMTAGSFEGRLGADLHDMLSDEIGNHSEHAADFCGRGGHGPYPITVMEYDGVFWVWALEHSPAGYFLSREDAEHYVRLNWADSLVECDSVDEEDSWS